MGPDGNPEPRRKKYDLLVFINWVGLDPLKTPHCIRKLCKSLKQPTAIHNSAQAILSYYAVMWKRKDYFHFACIYVLPLSFLNSVFPKASFFSKEGPNIIFSTVFYENRWGASNLCSTSRKLKMLWETKPCRKAKMRHQMKISAGR